MLVHPVKLYSLGRVNDREFHESCELYNINDKDPATVIKGKGVQAGNCVDARRELLSTTIMTTVDLDQANIQDAIFDA
ncbi:hypothetical protein HYFRA_00006475 [Hymenoscyphus fraxineus]|uniref:Uncharacterized protein n=1 Tax=Hymenoscyphus fraxineus TaxID=746836 RepID=A0A9N9KS73_9HELO|nr:hypothetical protein HYFRA_00006475 [Hymenoscyphus fraxineus]